MRIVLAVHDPPIWTLPADEVARIRATLSNDEVIDVGAEPDRRTAFSSADVVLTTWLSEDEAACLRRARWIHSTAVGVGGLLRDGVVSRGITVTNSRGVQSESIAEHALALALALRRGLHIARDRQGERTWAQEELYAHAVQPLSSTSVLIIGLGAIGSRVAALASALGMRVTGVRAREHLPVPAGVGTVVLRDRLHDALAEADVVVLAAPHTAGTRALIGDAELRAMRPSAILVNVARGALIDERALVEALAAGRLRGAGLDAFASEPTSGRQPALATAERAGHATQRVVPARLLGTCGPAVSG